MITCPLDWIGWSHFLATFLFSDSFHYKMTCHTQFVGPWREEEHTHTRIQLSHFADGEKSTKNNKLRYAWVASKMMNGMEWDENDCSDRWVAQAYTTCTWDRRKNYSFLLRGAAESHYKTTAFAIGVVQYSWANGMPCHAMTIFYTWRYCDSNWCTMIAYVVLYVQSTTMSR